MMIMPALVRIAWLLLAAWWHIVFTTTGSNHTLPVQCPTDRLYIDDIFVLFRDSCKLCAWPAALASSCVGKLLLLW